MVALINFNSYQFLLVDNFSLHNDQYILRIFSELFLNELLYIIFSELFLNDLIKFCVYFKIAYVYNRFSNLFLESSNISLSFLFQN